MSRGEVRASTASVSPVRVEILQNALRPSLEVLQVLKHLLSRLIGGGQYGFSPIVFSAVNHGVSGARRLMTGVDAGVRPR